MVTRTTTSCSCLRLFGLTICIILLALASSEEADAVVPEIFLQENAQPSFDADFFVSEDTSSQEGNAAREELELNKMKDEDELDGWHKANPQDPNSPLVPKVATFAKDYLNNALFNCGFNPLETEQGVEYNFTKVDLLHFVEQVEGGIGINAKVKAIRSDNQEYEFDFNIRRRLFTHPIVSPSTLVDGADAGNTFGKFMVHTVKPDPCPGHKSSTQGPFQGLTETQFKALPTGYITPKEGEYEVDNSPELTQQEVDNIPASWDWREKMPKAKAFQPPWDGQGSCGNCWAWAFGSVLSSRFWIWTKGKVNVNLSPQWITSCAKSQGCNGGNAHDGNGAVSSKGGVVDDECSPYAGVDTRSTNGQCNKLMGRLPIPKSCSRYHVAPVGDRLTESESLVQSQVGGKYTKRINGIAKTQQEIMKNGPVFGIFTVYHDFHNYKSGVYEHRVKCKTGPHAVTLIGWGEEDGKAYWLGLNSWGHRWGDKGFFKIRRGTNEAGIESHGVYTSTPDIKKLCPGTCENGGMDSECKCKCDAGYSGATCSKCTIACMGSQFKGFKAGNTCACECAEGYLGLNCDLKIDAPKIVKSGEMFKVDYSDPGLDPIVLQQGVRSGHSGSLNAGDMIVVYKEAQQPWSKKTGWAKEDSPAYVIENYAAGSASFTLYDPGFYKVLLINHLGKNEFGVDMGWSTRFQLLAKLSVEPCVEEHLAGACKDVTGAEYLCKMYKHKCAYVPWRRCGPAMCKAYIEKTTGRPIRELCPLTCNTCDKNKPNPENLPKCAVRPIMCKDVLTAENMKKANTKCCWAGCLTCASPYVKSLCSTAEKSNFSIMVEGVPKTKGLMNIQEACPVTCGLCKASFPGAKATIDRYNTGMKLPTKPSKCWIKLPTGCDKKLDETATPNQWFTDPKNTGYDCQSSRLKHFNSICGRWDADNHYGHAPPAGWGARKEYCWVRMPTGCPVPLRGLVRQGSSDWFKDYFACGNKKAPNRLADYNKICGRTDAEEWLGFNAPTWRQEKEFAEAKSMAVTKGVKQFGEACLQHCKKANGPCDWCGSGVCCQWGKPGNGCSKEDGIFDKGHVCVAPVDPAVAAAATAAAEKKAAKAAAEKNAAKAAAEKKAAKAAAEKKAAKAAAEKKAAKAAAEKKAVKAAAEKKAAKAAAEKKVAEAAAEKNAAEAAAEKQAAKASAAPANRPTKGPTETPTGAPSFAAGPLPGVEVPLKGMPVAQSSTGWGGAAFRAIDGITNTKYNQKSCTHTHRNNKPWWRVDLGSAAKVAEVQVWNRGDCCGGRLNKFQVRVGDQEKVSDNEQCGRGDNEIGQGQNKVVDCEGLNGRYVGVMLPKKDYLTLCEVKVFRVGGPTPEPTPAPTPDPTPKHVEISLKDMPVAQSSTGWGGAASRAIDGITNTKYNQKSCTHTHRNRNPWWRVDLGSAQEVGSVQVWNRGDCCGGRLNKFQVHVGDQTTVSDNALCAKDVAIGQGQNKVVDCAGKPGRYVSISLPKRDYLTLCEVKVFRK